MMTSSAVFFIFLLLTLLLTASSDLKKEAAALIYFINNVKIPPKSDYNWTKLQNSKIEVCDWKGIVCSHDNDSVIHLSLPGARLVGEIPQNCFGNLTALTRLSLHNNRLFGSIPEDFANLRSLKYVYLHKNNFSGPFPSVTKWTNLKHLYLSDNNFHGRLPNNVPSSIKPKNFSVSNNNFIGPIPESLSNKFDRNAFSGNIYLCGNLSLCNNKSIPWQSQSPSDSPSLSNNMKNKLCTAAIVAIAVGSALILLILFLYLRKKRSRAVKEKNAPGVATMARRGAFIEGDRNKLVFFEGGVYNFNLDDLLRASVEVLGKGSVGMWYKAVLHEGTTVVVKRLKDVVVSKKEFDGVMEGLGKMKNENVVPIRAYYYSKDEKLLVSDYFPAGSLSALLHGRRGSGCTPLDWDHRFRIALSAAKGVAYLHVTGKVVHGNIKPSNILLRQDSNKDACVSDFGLNTLFGGSQNTRVTGYHAPEVLETREVTFKSDVYSFGVLLLELLSGKAPNHASLHEKGTDLPSWVKSVKGEEWTVQEDWTTEVFDAQLMMYPNIKEKMVQLLQIAMTCVSTMPDQRPTMQDVVCKMEDMNWAEIDDGMRQSSDDPSKGSDGQTHPMESRNSPSTITP